MSQVHRISSTLPVVKVAYDGDSKSIGSPESEVDPHHTVDSAQMRSHFLIDAIVLALPKQVQIEVAQHGCSMLLAHWRVIWHVVVLLWSNHTVILLQYPCAFRHFAPTDPMA